VLLGANYRDLTDEERRQLQTNKGVCITLIVDNSPAYESDILAGDFVLLVDGKGPGGVAGFNDVIQANRGRSLELTISRTGNLITKTVKLLE
jgi:S1-C subfamily serine protease